jgi:hypothetical protein
MKRHCGNIRGGICLGCEIMLESNFFHVETLMPQRIARAREQ